jgi:TfoX/Sxy family transcriptional regulator of competence genes
VEAFDAVLPGLAERRRMFGYPAAFVNGNMFMGLWQDHFLLRLGDRDRAALLAVAGARRFEPQRRRALREYVLAPARVVADRGALRTWVGRALRHAAALPPKAGRGEAPRAAAGGRRAGRPAPRSRRKRPSP